MLGQLDSGVASVKSQPSGAPVTIRFHAGGRVEDRRQGWPLRGNTVTEHNGLQSGGSLALRRGAFAA